MRSKGFKNYIGFARSILYEKIGTGTPIEKEYIKIYGVFGGGFSGDYENTIDYVIISNPSNATDFGDLTVARDYLSATSNGADDRGIFGGGRSSSSDPENTIDYITILTPSNATDFGDLTIARKFLAATSNGTNDRGVFGGGYSSSSDHENTIDYVTISTPSNATDFGDLTVGRQYLAATSNGTNDRGIFGGGVSSSGNENIMDYITISSPSNATDFGDLTIARQRLAATSNGTNDRGIFGGGYTTEIINTIDYVTISTPGNATDFGDLTIEREWLAATSNGTNDRGIFGGGYSNAGMENTIDYVTISTPSNATDFGDLTVARDTLAATSNA